MSQTQDEAAQASIPEPASRSGSEQTLPDGSGGVITRTAPSVAGETYHGGTIVENDVGDSPEELMAAIDATIKPFDEGDIVSGEIVKIDKDEVLLDIGYKSEGVIPLRELSIRNDVDPHDVVSLGEAVEALVTQKEDAEGRLMLSKKKAQYERAWGRIEEIKNRDGTVEGPVIEVVKGGLILDIGLRGFLPASLVEMRRVRDLHPYVGRGLECRIIELDKNRNNVVLSRRKFLEESQAEQRQGFLTSLTKGEVRTGTVSSIVNFGAFVDLGGVDGLVHVSELSWKHVDHPSEVVEVGKDVQVEVLDVDLERERVSLSLKATQEDPWRQFARQRQIGEIIEGRVTKLVPFGAFVELDDAIEGLVHISELAERHVEKAEDEVSVHDRIPVKIIDIDLDRRRISLSRKQAMRAGMGSADTEAAAEIELESEGGEASELATEDLTPSPEAAEVPEDTAAPEVADMAELAGQAAPPEEREEAEAIRLMTPDSPPEGREGVIAAESDKPSTEVRISQEEPEEGAVPGTAVDELVAEDASEQAAESVDDPSPAFEETGERAGDESIESIVEDLKRRGDH
ncbi:MAG: 30S ribosomal protein S1 [Actinomycetota bacterium]